MNRRRSILISKKRHHALYLHSTFNVQIRILEHIYLNDPHYDSVHNTVYGTYFVCTNILLRNSTTLTTILFVQFYPTLCLLALLPALQSIVYNILRKRESHDRFCVWFVFTQISTIPVMWCYMLWWYKMNILVCVQLQKQVYFINNI